MQTFLTRHHDEIKGVLSGFDRIRFRGTLRWLATASGLESYRTTSRILLKEFKPWALGLTEQIKQAPTKLAASLDRPIRFVTNSRFSKEDIAADIAKADGVTEGLVCVLTAVEPCRTFFLRRDRERRRIEIHSQSGKCLHQYFYLRHPQLGQIHPGARSAWGIAAERASADRPIRTVAKIRATKRSVVRRNTRESTRESFRFSGPQLVQRSVSDLQNDQLRVAKLALPHA